MHNFAPPSTFKAWIDYVVRIGRTFSYGANGPQGLLKGKHGLVRPPQPARRARPIMDARSQPAAAANS
jgi:FMN-dependent NADH-azoreductase